VRGYDRSPRRFDHIEEGFVGNMRDVHHHPDAVHLGDDLASKIGQTVMVFDALIINVAGCLGGLSSGLIAQQLRNWHCDLSVIGLRDVTFYELLFALSGVLRLIAAVAFLPMIHEPTARPTREALRFMTSNIYNNLFNGILMPLRVLRLRAKESYAADRT